MAVRKRRVTAPKRKRRPLKKSYPVVIQRWEESEKGWGVRPDGYSLHLTEADRLAFIADYWGTMPDQTPDEYSRPSGRPYLADVGAKLYAVLKATKNGLSQTGEPPKPA